MKLISAYIDDEVAEAIERVAASKHMSKSSVIAEILNHYFFFSSCAILLAIEENELKSWLIERDKLKENLEDTEQIIKRKQAKIEELREEVAKEWIIQQIDDIMLAKAAQPSLEPLKELELRIETSQGWLKEVAGRLIKESGSEIEKVIKEKESYIT